MFELFKNQDLLAFTSGVDPNKRIMVGYNEVQCGPGNSRHELLFA